MRLHRIFFLIALLPLLVSAQALEDDDPNDRRYWGYSSSYQSQINELGASVYSLPIPMLFGVEVGDLTKNFGDSRGGGTRTHQGLDIMAPQGTPVASPTDAIVVRTGNGANSGVYIRTANPGGENFVYMHLSSIAQGIDVGDKVLRGEIIGFVGNTGNASGGPSHLHFEIRSGGTAQDPFPRLTAVFTKEDRAKSISDAQAKGIAISADILARLNDSGSSPAPQPTAAPFRAALVYGESNADVVELQRLLIASAQGSASIRLKNTGATGYFGPLTREALMEYQRSKNLDANGIVDERTYTHIFASQSEGTSAESVIVGNGASTSTPTFARNLEVGVTGADVRALQIFLNTHRFPLAESGPGSPGSETDMFGGLTRAALSRFQSANNISPAAGYFGPITRALIGQM